MKAWRSVRGPTRLVIAGQPGDAAHDPAGGVAVEALAGGVDEDGAIEAFADRQVDGAGDPWRRRHHGELAALALHGEGAMRPFQAEAFDVGTDGFGDAQPVPSSA